MKAQAKLPASSAPTVVSNAEIADRLASLAQLLSTQKENPYKVKAYRRAAASIRTLSESIDGLVREDADLTRFPGIGEATLPGVSRSQAGAGAQRKKDHADTSHAGGG